MALIARWCIAPIVLASLASSAAPEPAVEYTRYKLFQLAVLADVVVSGEIIDVGEKTFEVAVEERIAGEATAARLHVQRFRNWTCAHRWAEYERGQRLVFF